MNRLQVAENQEALIVKWTNDAIAGCHPVKSTAVACWLQRRFQP